MNLRQLKYYVGIVEAGNMTRAAEQLHVAQTTLVSVLTRQIDIGWAAPPFGLKERREGKIRIVARGSDAASLNRQTVRAIVVNAHSLETKRDAMLRFARGYREAVDWMYADDSAIALYARKVGMDVDLLKDSVQTFHPKRALQTKAVENMPDVIRDAIALKFIAKAPTPEQQGDFIQIPD